MTVLFGHPIPLDLLSKLRDRKVSVLCTQGVQLSSSLVYAFRTKVDTTLIVFYREQQQKPRSGLYPTIQSATLLQMNVAFCQLAEVCWLE